MAKLQLNQHYLLGRHLQCEHQLALSVTVADTGCHRL